MQTHAHTHTHKHTVLYQYVWASYIRVLVLDKSTKFKAIAPIKLQSVYKVCWNYVAAAKIINTGLDTLCFYFCLLFYSICSPVMPIMLLKLTNYTNYAEKFLVHRQNISFSMQVHALNRGPHVIITFSRREGFESSLLFSLV